MAEFFRVDGLSALVHDIRKHATESPGMAANITAHHAGRIVDRWRNSVPDPAPQGEQLRNSIQHDFYFSGRDPVGVAYSDWMVARFREYGTSREAPKGEAAAALEAEIPDFQRALRDLPRL